MTTAETVAAPSAARREAAFLSRAIELAAASVAHTANGTPIGAVLVLGGEVIGEGASSVIDGFDPTAHAEVQAIRSAGAAGRTHLFPGSVMYTSLAPCPLCLAACYWAQVSRVVYGAGYDESARFGFEDRWMYDEFARPVEQRALPVEAAAGPWQAFALGPCYAWARKHGRPVGD